MSQRLGDEDVERIARRVVAKIAKLAMLVALLLVGLWLFLTLFLYAFRASGPSGMMGAAGWLVTLAAVLFVVSVLAGWRLLRRGL
jgi:polyferredoxin